MQRLTIITDVNTLDCEVEMTLWENIMTAWLYYVSLKSPVYSSKMVGSRQKSVISCSGNTALLSRMSFLSGTYDRCGCCSSMKHILQKLLLCFVPCIFDIILHIVLKKCTAFSLPVWADWKGDQYWNWGLSCGLKCLAYHPRSLYLLRWRNKEVYNHTSRPAQTQLHFN